MLDISPCAHWPFACLLWRTVYSTLFLNFIFYCWLVWVIYVLWILILYQIDNLHIFLPYCGLPFHSFESVPWCVSFSFWWSSIYFSFVPCGLSFLSKKSYQNPMSWRFSPMFSSKSSLIFVFSFRHYSSWINFCIK